MDIYQLDYTGIGELYPRRGVVPAKKYRIELTTEEQQELKALVSKGRAAAYKQTHARILLLSDEVRKDGGLTDEEVPGPSRSPAPQWNVSRTAKDYGRPRSSSSPTSPTGTTRPKRRTWKPDWDRHGPPHPEETPLVVDPFASDLNPALTSGHTTIAALNQRKPASRVRRYFQKSATAIAINTITLSDKTISMSTPR